MLIALRDSESESSRRTLHTVVVPDTSDAQLPGLCRALREEGGEEIRKSRDRKMDRGEAARRTAYFPHRYVYDPAPEKRRAHGLAGETALAVLSRYSEVQRSGIKIFLDNILE